MNKNMTLINETTEIPDFIISDEDKIVLIEEKMKDILEILGLDLKDPSLNRTPYRIAKMYVKELFEGLNENNFPDISLFENPNLNDSQLVLCKDITVNSFCEHHFLPFLGKAHVAYIPGEKIIGLSKLNRIVNYYSRRPQVQERLTSQIANKLKELLGIKSIAVTIVSQHFCVVSRGIRDSNSQTLTHSLHGDFKHCSEKRHEYFESIR